MKRPGLMFLLAWLPASVAVAQVTVEVTLDQEQFLGGEPLPAAVRVVNRSGQTLHFGDDPEWLTFSVESRDGYIVVKTGEVPVLGEFDLESSKMATRNVDLAPYFQLAQPGRYHIVATLRIKEWNTSVTSKPKSFDLVPGARLWSQEFGVPAAAGETHSIPEVRRYTLQQANYQRTHPRLYLRLTDGAESKLFKVFSVGPIVSFSRPEPQFDKASNLHLLFQNGARTFSYLVVNPDGDVIVRQTYEYVTSRPKLQLDKEGKFFVAGGVRRPTSSDVPPPAPPASDTPAPPANP